MGHKTAYGYNIMTINGKQGYLTVNQPVKKGCTVAVCRMQLLIPSGYMILEQNT